MIRHLSQHQLHRPAFVNFLRDSLAEEGHDPDEIGEHLEAYDKLMSFIASHGLEPTKGAAWRRGFRHGYRIGYEKAVRELKDAIDKWEKAKLDS
jgi:hypothetical protein